MTNNFDMKTLKRSISTDDDDMESPVSCNQYSTATSSIIGKWKASFKRKISGGSPTPSMAGRSPRDMEATISIGQLSFDEFLQEDPSDMVDTDVLSVKICKEEITASIQSMMRCCNGDMKILEAIEEGRNSATDLITSASKQERKIALLWTAFLKRKEFLPAFMPTTDLEFSTPEDGLTALHLAAFSASPECVKFLLQSGAKISTPQAVSPLHCAALGRSIECINLLLKAGANVNNINYKDLNLFEPQDSPLHCAIKSNSPECMNTLISAGADVNAIGQGGLSPLHIAVDLGFHECLKTLLESGTHIDINAKTQDRRGFTALHLAAEEENVETIQILLRHKADPDLRNMRAQTALHVAARVQSVECINALIHKSIDVNAGDADRRTPLHAAVGRAALAAEAVEALVKASGIEINKTDRYGHTPLHVAALNELPTASAVLIRHGADLTARTKRGATALGLVIRKAPAALYAIEEVLDSSIRMSYETNRDRDCELKLDFRPLLQGPGSVEVSLLSTFIAEEHPEILQHPLCQAFLHLKWQAIRKFYIARLLLSLLLVISLSSYVYFLNDCVKPLSSNDTVDFKSCYSKSIGGFKILYGIQWTLLVFVCAEMIRKLYGLCAALFAPTAVSTSTALRIYFTQFDNYFEWFTILCSLYLSDFVSGQNFTQIKAILGAFAMLAGWSSCMTMIGQLPLFGAYVPMYICVLSEFIKLLLAYICLLFGFAISFCVMFGNDFSNPFTAFVKVLVMMTGELEFKDLIPQIANNDNTQLNNPVFYAFSCVIFVLFLLLVTVALMNLLVGIAVHDIHGLRTSAGLEKLKRQAELVNYVETALSGCSGCPRFHRPNWCSTRLHCVHNTRQKRSNSTILHIKPHNLRDTRLPRDIVRAAFDVAKCHKSNMSVRGTYLRRGSRIAFNRQNSDVVCNQQVTLRKEMPTMTTRRRRTTYIKSEEAEKDIDLSQEVDLQGQLKQLADDVEDLRQLLISNQALLRSLTAAAQPVHDN